MKKILIYLVLAMIIPSVIIGATMDVVMADKINESIGVVDVAKEIDESNIAEEELKNALDVSMLENSDDEDDEAQEEDLQKNNYVIHESIPEIYIKAINPGYTIDGKNNVGEMIEIARKNSDTPILLAGVTVGYTNSSGNTSILFEFPENSWMTGETILLRLASSPGSELASVNYTKTLAFKAAISLEVDDEIMDEVCWNGAKGCYSEFKSNNHTTLVRNLETGEFDYSLNYEPHYDSESYLIKQESEKTETIANQCKGVEFSEILTYYETLKTEQFIELHNRNAWQIKMDGCQIRYKNKNYILAGTIEPDGYFVYYPSGFSLTKNPTNSNVLDLIDVNGDIVDILTYPNGQRKGTSYALISFDENGDEIWRVTYAPTPGMENNYQEFKTCEIGKVINLETGNCVKATTVAVAKTCKAGYYLNPLTGRCKKQKTETKKTCKEGYYLNPETNRCRKNRQNSGANYDLESENYEEESSFVALYAVLGVLAAGGVYLVYEFRHEIAKLFDKAFRRFR